MCSCHLSFNLGAGPLHPFSRPRRRRALHKNEASIRLSVPDGRRHVTTALKNSFRTPFEHHLRQADWTFFSSGNTSAKASNVSRISSVRAKPHDVRGAPGAVYSISWCRFFGNPVSLFLGPATGSPTRSADQLTHPYGEVWTKLEPLLSRCSTSEDTP